MTNRSPKRRTLIVAALSLAAVLASFPAAAALLAIGTAMALRALLVEAGTARFAPVAVLVAIVLGAFYAPVKTIERVKARNITIPKSAMTVAELRDPIGHDLPHYFLPCYFAESNTAVGLDDHVVRFASPELTVAEFIQAIEEQTPLRHRFMSCGNGHSSILFGRNCALGLMFRQPVQ